MINPKISVIVPIYNVGKYLRECIESVLAQTYTDFELLLIDDGSKDDSPIICNEFASVDSRVHAFHKLNGGVTSARNYGLDRSSGEWIMFVDGDDWIEPTLFQELIEKAEVTGADIVMCDFAFCYDTGCLVRNDIYHWEKQGHAGLREYLATVWTPVWGSIQRRSLYTEFNLRSRTNTTYLEDFHLITRLCFYAGTISKVNRPLYNYRQQDASIMHTFNEKCVTDGVSVYNEIIDFFRQNDCYDEFKDVLAWRSLNLCLQMLFDPSKFRTIKEFNPDKKHFIFSCPLKHISLKAKMMFWCITHRMPSVAKILLVIRQRVK